jgi:hypothetical protein
MLALLLSAIGCGALCFCLGRYDRALTLARWRFVLSASGKRALATLRERMEVDATLARHAFETAQDEREERPREAAAVLGVALAVLEEAGADRQNRLAAMRVYSRMLLAIQPVKPPSPIGLRIRNVRAVVRTARLVQPFLVGGAERFRLWLLTLGLALRMLLRGARRATDAAARRPDAEAPWTSFALHLGDFETLDASHLAALETLVVSLSAVDTGERVRLWDTIFGS